ncbi:MAG TPA: methyltransferase domain-containing protein [Anaerolineaceae bacterium]
MDDLPVCNYEGSDYQTSFWERGGRAYEDAAEAVALRRLMPTGGKCLLELGAGAGRNTLRYRGFDQIVLLDYSRTQLVQARQRLGDQGPDGARLRYVAADIYHLPFVSGLFDAATMIRTLHHMVDPRLALSQVRQALSMDATFILEFANKRNIKSVLRYALHQQGWNPFSPEPIEFAPLNFDFHPATVRSWLQLTGFCVERQLTVSHFRMGFFKRLVPLGLLVRMDALASLTGDLWQLSPSVFVRSTARPVPAATALDEPAPEGSFFRCPACSHAPLPDVEPGVENAELTCPECGKHYPLVDGIYDLRPNPPERE